GARVGTWVRLPVSRARATYDAAARRSRPPRRTAPTHRHARQGAARRNPGPAPGTDGARSEHGTTIREASPMDPRHGRPARTPDPTVFASHQLRRHARSRRHMPRALLADRDGRAVHRSLYDGGEPDLPFRPPARRARRPARPLIRGAPWDGGPRHRLFDAAEPGGERRSGVERRSGKDRRSGPFPGGRRATDRQPPDAAAAGWRSRAREFVRRFRDPLIGLTIAGAAAPLATAVTTAPKGKQPQ